LKQTTTSNITVKEENLQEKMKKKPTCPSVEETGGQANHREEREKGMAPVLAMAAAAIVETERLRAAKASPLAPKAMSVMWRRALLEPLPESVRIPRRISPEFGENDGREKLVEKLGIGNVPPCEGIGDWEERFFSFSWAPLLHV
jgi:hypothetical protein